MNRILREEVHVQQLHITHDPCKYLYFFIDQVYHPGHPLGNLHPDPLLVADKFDVHSHSFEHLLKIIIVVYGQISNTHFDERTDFGQAGGQEKGFERMKFLIMFHSHHLWMKGHTLKREDQFLWTESQLHMLQIIFVNVKRAKLAIAVKLSKLCQFTIAILYNDSSLLNTMKILEK